MGGTYTTKELAEKLNKPIEAIYRIKQKYSHLFSPEHCIDLADTGCLIWDKSVIKQMEDLFLLELKKSKDHISNWNTKKELARILNIKPAKLDQYFNEIEESLLVDTDYGYWQQNGSVTQRWSKTGIARLCEYMEYLHGYSHQPKEDTPSFTQSDFDKVIADLEAQIDELKAKHPQFSKIPLKRTVLSPDYTETKPNTVELRGEGCTTNFTVEGINTKVLFPDYPATKRREVTELTPNSIQPVQLAIATDISEPEDNPEETFYDRMRAFAAENGIEIKTMQIA